jgi:hypothetical protein
VRHAAAQPAALEGRGGRRRQSRRLAARPVRRFVLVALRPEDFAYFSWPEPQGDPGTVGETLVDLMAANGWPGAEDWARRANDIAPTIVGGSKRHGGAAHDPVYAILRDDGGFLTMDQVLRRLPAPMEIPAFERHLAHLRRDFRIEVDPRKSGDAYRLGEFRAFVGQDDHLRHEAFARPVKIS